MYLAKFDDIQKYESGKSEASFHIVGNWVA
jgi:hypothetical protein